MPALDHVFVSTPQLAEAVSAEKIALAVVVRFELRKSTVLRSPSLGLATNKATGNTSRFVGE